MSVAELRSSDGDLFDGPCSSNDGASYIEHEWEVICVSRVPGLIHVKNFLTPQQQEG